MDWCERRRYNAVCGGLGHLFNVACGRAPVSMNGRLINNWIVAIGTFGLASEWTLCVCAIWVIRVTSLECLECVKIESKFISNGH